MRKKFSDVVEAGRIITGPMFSNPRETSGAFRLKAITGAMLQVIAYDGMGDIQWEHVSVSVSGKNRCPEWQEMCQVKAWFFEDEEVVIQYHPAKSNYVNVHPGVLHLWKPIGIVIPCRPSSACDMTNKRIIVKHAGQWIIRYICGGCGEQTKSPSLACYLCRTRHREDDDGSSSYPGSEIVGDVTVFIMACQAEKERLQTSSLTPKQILSVARKLGYRKISVPEQIDRT